MSALLVGIDENGLGPRLGPLLVTGVLASASAEGARWLRSEGAGAMARLDDSKKLASFHRPEVAEAWARALVPGALDPDALVEEVSLLRQDELRALCPRHVEAQCWSPSPPFQADTRVQAEVASDLEDLRRRGVRVLAVRSAILCSERLHRSRDAGHSLLTTDLHAMESLLLALREQADGEIDAVCGKVGALDKYLPRLGALSGIPATIEEEGKAASRYRFAGLGSVAFVRDADSSDLLVALASLVGKYLREVLMSKIAAYYLRQDPSLPRPSGYRDPVTARFVEGSASLRRLALVPDRCFLRP
jgi:ribonuclease HII